MWVKKHYEFFFSSPSDCEDLFEEAEKIIKQFNQSGITDKYQPSFEMFNYKSFASEFGSKAQDLINKKLFPKDQPTNFEFYLGVLRHRFGQATENYTSGTEEEFQQAITRLKANDRHLQGVAFLFSKEALEDTTSQALQEKQKINQFQEKISPEGLYKTFKDREAYWREVSAQLGSWAKSVSSVQEMCELESPFELNISDDFLKELNDLDPLIWGKSNAEVLEDVWVEPKITIDLVLENQNELKQEDISFEQIKKDLIDGSSFSLRGVKNAGKTLLGKKLFLDLLRYKRGYIPIFLKGKKIRHSDKQNILKRIKFLASQQYKNFSQTEAQDIENHKLILIIDDIFQSQIDSRALLAIRREICEEVHSCIFLGRYTDEFEEQDFKETEYNDFKRGDIHRPKAEKTDATIRRWYSLSGGSFPCEENEIVKIYKQLDHILKAGFLERNFFNILLLLRTLNFDSVDKNEKGDIFYYKLLVLNHLKNHLSKEKIEIAEELLSRLAWRCLILGVSSIPEKDCHSILFQWAEDNALSYTDLEEVLCSLLECNILEKKDKAIEFSQAYVSAYYEAKILYKKLAQSDSEAVDILNKFHSDTWTRKSAMTLEFFASLDHGTRALDLVLDKIKRSFAGNQVLRIGSPHLVTLAGSVNLIRNSEVNLQKNSQDSRKAHLQKEDTHSEQRKQKPLERLSAAEELFSSIRVAGNLLRDNYSSLSKVMKKQILLESTLAMRRLLEEFLCRLISEYKKFIDGKIKMKLKQRIF